MTTTSITLNRALTLITKAEDTLKSQISSGLFVSGVVGVAQKPVQPEFKTKAELVAHIQSCTDKVNSSFVNIPKLKEAIAKKNLETTVMFCGEEVSITRLLAIKTQLKMQKLYLTKLKNQTQNMSSTIASVNASIASQTSGVEASHLDSVLASLKASQGIEMITGTKDSAAVHIQKIEEQVDFLTQEVDFVLSEVNIATSVEVDFEL